MGGRISGAAARTIRSPDDAEQVAAEWMRHLGFGDARCTGAGTDGGVDVRSREAIARERRGLLFAERVSFAGQGWIWVQLVRLDYTVDRRGAVAHRATTLAFDLVSGAPFPGPGTEPSRWGGDHPVGEGGPLAATM